MRWTIRRGGELLWRSWDDREFLLYDTTSGDTHLLNQVTAAVLRALAQSPLDEHELERVVSSSLNLADDPDFRAAIPNLLEHLDRVGLLEPVS